VEAGDQLGLGLGQVEGIAVGLGNAAQEVDAEGEDPREDEPQAGFALRFDITVTEVRNATSEELADADAQRLPEFLRLAEPRSTTLH